MDRRFFLKLLAVLGMLAFPAATVLAQPYVELPEPMETIEPGKIEVLSFFSYGCNHCKDLDPLLEKWEKTLPEDVNFVRVPVTFSNPPWTALARIYLSLETMGLVDKLNQKVFTAVHSNVRLDREDILMEWIGKQGVDVNEFGKVWKSFSVQTQLQRANQLAKQYRVNAVPLMAVNGRYLVSPGSAGGYPQLLKTADELIAKSRPSS